MNKYLRALTLIQLVVAVVSEATLREVGDNIYISDFCFYSEANFKGLQVCYHKDSAGSVPGNFTSVLSIRLIYPGTLSLLDASGNSLGSITSSQPILKTEFQGLQKATFKSSKTEAPTVPTPTPMQTEVPSPVSISPTPIPADKARRIRNQFIRLHGITAKNTK